MRNLILGKPEEGTRADEAAPKTETRSDGPLASTAEPIEAPATGTDQSRVSPGVSSARLSRTGTSSRRVVGVSRSGDVGTRSQRDLASSGWHSGRPSGSQSNLRRGRT